MESATAENEASVRAARQRVAAAEAAGTPVSRRDAVVEDVYRLLMEANSGASFEQYFRWATADWSDEQEQRLSDLFDEFEQHNGRILNALGRYASGSLD